MSKVTQGCMGMFSKAAPAADATKLKPGIALPHVTLPTTEVGRGGRGLGQKAAPAAQGGSGRPGALAAAAAAAGAAPPPSHPVCMPALCRVGAWRWVPPPAAGSWWLCTAASTTHSASHTSPPFRWGQWFGGWGGVGQGRGGQAACSAALAAHCCPPLQHMHLLRGIHRQQIFLLPHRCRPPPPVCPPSPRAAASQHTQPTTHAPRTLQHLMPEFEEMNCDVVAVSADTRGKACSFVSAVPRWQAGGRAGGLEGWRVVGSLLCAGGWAPHALWYWSPPMEGCLEPSTPLHCLPAASGGRPARRGAGRQPRHPRGAHRLQGTAGAAL